MVEAGAIGVGVLVAVAGLFVLAAALLLELFLEPHPIKRIVRRKDAGRKIRFNIWCSYSSVRHLPDRIAKV